MSEQTTAGRGFHLPPGILASIEDPEVLREFICGVCGDGSLPIVGVIIPDLDSGRICHMFDLQPSILPSPGNFLLVGEVRVNERPATFCGNCYPRIKELSLANGGTPWKDPE